MIDNLKAGNEQRLVEALVANESLKSTIKANEKAIEFLKA